VKLYALYMNKIIDLNTRFQFYRAI